AITGSAPARSSRFVNKPARIRTRTGEVGARHAAGYTTGLRRRASGRSRTCATTVRRVRAAVDTTEAKVETAGVEPASPRCKRGALPHELHPRMKGGRPDSNRRRADHNRECCRYTTVTMNGDDRIRTGGLSPDKRALCALSYAPNIDS